MFYSYVILVVIIIEKIEEHFFEIITIMIMIIIHTMQIFYLIVDLNRGGFLFDCVCEWGRPTKGKKINDEWLVGGECWISLCSVSGCSVIAGAVVSALYL